MLEGKKKYLQSSINGLLFIHPSNASGTGSLNHVDGYPLTGFVVDRGEPSGKNDNHKDQFHIEVRNPVSNVIVFETDFLLDGGNVQVHPPVGHN
jgi:hypothetical protein